jgi:hypothetical protein
MKTYQTQSGHNFHYEPQEVPLKDGTPVRWDDVWATITPKDTEQNTLSFSWDLVREMAVWLKAKRVQHNFRIIVGWDKSVREHQGQIFKIFEPAEAIDLVLGCATADEYRVSRPQSLAPLPGWQKDVFTKRNCA